MNKYIIIRDLYKKPHEYWCGDGLYWTSDRPAATTYEGHAGEAVVARRRRAGDINSVLDLVERHPSSPHEGPQGDAMTHDQIVFACGQLHGLALRLEAGGSLDAEDIAFMKKFSVGVLENERAWAAALEKQEDDAALAAIHQASWGPQGD